jgi:amino acid transporter
VSTLAGEVRNPGRTFPKALLMAVLLVVSMYLLPTMAALGVAPADDSGSGWGLGYYGKVADQVGGLCVCMCVCVCVCGASHGGG